MVLVCWQLTLKFLSRPNKINFSILDQFFVKGSNCQKKLLRENWWEHFDYCICLDSWKEKFFVGLLYGWQWTMEPKVANWNTWSKKCVFEMRMHDNKMKDRRKMKKLLKGWRWHQLRIRWREIISDGSACAEKLWHSGKKIWKFAILCNLKVVEMARGKAKEKLIRVSKGILIKDLRERYVVRQF